MSHGWGDAARLKPSSDPHTGHCDHAKTTKMFTASPWNDRFVGDKRYLRHKSGNAEMTDQLLQKGHFTKELLNKSQVMTMTLTEGRGLASLSLVV